MRIMNIETYFNFFKFRFEIKQRSQSLKFLHNHLIVHNFYYFVKIL